MIGEKYSTQALKAQIFSSATAANKAALMMQWARFNTMTAVQLKGCAAQIKPTISMFYGILVSMFFGITDNIIYRTPTFVIWVARP